MTLTVETNVNRVDRAAWQQFVMRHPHGNIFQSPAIYDLFSATKNYQPVFVAILNKSKQILGLLNAVIQKENQGPLGLLSSRTIIWGGPLISDNAPTGENAALICDTLLRTIIAQTQKRAIYIQFRNLFDLTPFAKVFLQHGFSYQERLNYIVETDQEEEVKRRMSKSKVREINRGLKAGSQLIEPECLEQVEEFYCILKNLYRTKVKKPLPDWSFFEKFFEMSRENRLGRYFLIEHQKKIIGGSMCPIMTNQFIYEWYHCGLDREHKRFYPSVLATWAPIAHAIKNGVRGFDFMGAGRPDLDYGVREFKSKFGGKLVSFGRFERINRKVLYKMGKMGIQIMSKL